MSDFWNRTNAFIKALNKTQRSLSVECGFSERKIENQSTNDRIPNADEAVKIAQARGTSVEYLVTGQDSNPAEIELRELKAKLKNFYTSL